MHEEENAQVMTRMPVDPELCYCKVALDGIELTSNEFFVFIPTPEGGMKAYYNSDALSAAMALSHMANVFSDMYAACDDEEKAIITSVMMPEEAGTNDQV